LTTVLMAETPGKIKTYFRRLLGRVHGGAFKLTKIAFLES